MLDVKLTKQIEIFSSSPQKDLVEDDKLLLVVTSIGKTNFVFNVTDENNSFSFTTPGFWFSGGGLEFMGLELKLILNCV